MSDIEEVKDLAVKFRSAIEKAISKLTFATFSSFPKGSCGDASLLLKRYLESKQLKDVRYVVGLNRNHHSHAWLIWKGIIIDITLDQFGEQYEKVFVSNDSDFHKQFKYDIDISDVKIEDYDPHTRTQLMVYYEIIMSHL